VFAERLGDRQSKVPILPVAYATVPEVALGGLFHAGASLDYTIHYTNDILLKCPSSSPLQ
jgi:hypothetical protein